MKNKAKAAVINLIIVGSAIVALTSGWKFWEF
jgi:hypothetical protein